MLVGDQVRSNNAAPTNTTSFSIIDGKRVAVNKMPRAMPLPKRHKPVQLPSASAANLTPEMYVASSAKLVSCLSFPTRMGKKKAKGYVRERVCFGDSEAILVCLFCVWCGVGGSALSAFVGVATPRQQHHVQREQISKMMTILKSCSR